MKEDSFIIEGMTCAACSSSVERVTSRLPGVEYSMVNLAAQRMLIRYDESRVTPEQIMERVVKAGFGIHPAAAGKLEKPQEDDLRPRKRRLIAAAVFSALLLYLSMGQMFFKNLPVPWFLSMSACPAGLAVAELVLTLPVLWCGRSFFSGGFKALRSLSPTMDTLVALGSGSSFLFSLVMTVLVFRDGAYVHQLFYESSAVVLTLIMLGKYFEARSMGKTRMLIYKLMELAPDTALLVENGRTHEIPAAALVPGDVFLVKPGARIPADGTVTDGNGTVNESMLTGESLPVEKAPGSTVTGGSVSFDGAMYVRTDRVGADATLAKIVRLVEEAQGRKAPVSRLADKVSGVFVPVVMAVALLSAAVWLLAGKDLFFALRIFVCVLVIACPCALGLATPTAIMVGTALGASHGILIRSGEALENAGHVDTVVLDKTGTVTTGEPDVSYVSSRIGEDELLRLAASAESMSAHPVAKAICRRAGKADLYPVARFENLSGKGIRAVLEDGRTVLAGSRKLMEESGADAAPAAEGLEQIAAMGATAVVVAVDGRVCGVIGAADAVRPTSAEAVRAMKAAGLTVCLLTGDSQAAAAHVGGVIGADLVRAEVLPGGKADVIKSLKAEGRKVMMVGDGVNDAPALTEADVGAAIGSGSDIAVESGDVVLMSSDLMDVPRAVRLSRLTLTNIKENLFWAFCYNIICVPIAAGALYPAFGLLLSPMIAGLAMSLSSVCVVGNALRLRRKKL